MLLIIVFALLLGVSCGYALISGGRSEQAVAIIMILGSAGSMIAAHPPARLWHGTENGILLIDLLALLAFAIITLLSDRFWPIWTTGFQLLSVAAHFGPMLRSANIAIPFAFEEEVWGYVILVQLILVTRSSRRSASERAAKRWSLF